jgi:chromate reductase
MTKKIAVLVGSLRKDSWNKKIALALMQLAPASLHMEIIEIGQLPLYNQDFDEQPLKEWTAFRDKIKSFDGILFITPEYNRSVPGVLKNAIDIGSRPYGKSVWEGKPSAIVSVSIGAIAGFGANHHLRQSLVFLNMPCMPQPEAYLGNIASVFDSEGQVTNENTKAFLHKFIEAYAQWVNKILA